MSNIDFTGEESQEDLQVDGVETDLPEVDENIAEDDSEEPTVAQSKSRDTRPSLTPSDKPGVVPLLDLTENGIHNDAELMAKYFPLVRGILTRTNTSEALTIDEVNELSRFALAKAMFTKDPLNKVEGMLDNQLHSPDGTKQFGPHLNKPRLSEGAELDLTDLTTLEATIHGGGVVTCPLVNSGFRIKLEPLGTDGEIKLEESITHRIGEVGRSTVGGGILAMDAVIIDAAIDKILDKVIDHNIEGVAIGDKAALRSYISHKDIRPLLGIMTGIMHLDGYTYDVPCSKCETSNRMNLNVLRSMHYDHGKLTESQLDQLLIPLKTKIKPKQIRKYQEEFSGHAMTRTFKIGKLDYRVHLRTGSIEDKSKAYALVFNIIEKLARDIVGINGVRSTEEVDDKCQELLERMWHVHYLPIVSQIDILLPQGTKEAKQPEVILQLLKTLSVADTTGEFASYLTEFAYDNVITFATHVPECGVCGHTTEELRYYDPVIDFFIRQMSHTLSTSIVQEVMMRS